MPETAERPPRPPAPSKIKILQTANELFYDEGVNNVGVDRIIAASHVTKATFYKHYRAKDLLIVAYVGERDAELRAFVEAKRENGDAASSLRAIVGRIADEAKRPGFHGCPFINAASGYADPEHPIRAAVDEWRAWYRSTLVALLSEAGSPAPEDSADDLLLARDGALSGGNVADPAAVDQALQRSVDRALAA